MAERNRPTTDEIGDPGGEQAQPQLDEIGGRPGINSDLEARRAAAQRSEYDPEDLTVENGEVRLRDDALRQEAAEQTVYDPNELRVTDDGGVEPRRDPAPEATRVVLGEDDPSGEVAWVGPDGKRIETGATARGADGAPYSAYVDVPDREGEWQLQVGDETVDRVEVGSAGAARDTPQADIPRGWNSTVIEVDAEEGTGSVAQDAYDPDERYTSASTDPDVVAGSGADEALQAGADPEELSPRNPIDDSEGERIADRIDGPQTDQGESTTISDPTDLNDADDNRAVRERVASELEGVSADEVDIVATGSGYEAVGPGGETVTSVGSGGGVPGRQPTDATYSGPARSVGDRLTGAGVTAGLEAARRQARQQVASQSDRIDEADVQTGVVDGQVRATVDEQAVQGQADRALEQAPEGGDIRLANEADTQDQPFIEGGDVRLYESAEDQRAVKEGGDQRLDTISDPTEAVQNEGGDQRLRTISDPQTDGLAAGEVTAEEPLNYGRRAKYAAGVDVLLGSVDDAVARSLRTDDPVAAADALAGSTDEAIGRAARASAAGDRQRAADNLAGDIDDTVRGSTAALRDVAADPPGAPGSDTDTILPGYIGDATATGATLGEELRTADVDSNVGARVTEGGLLSERDEQRLTEAGQQFSVDARSTVDRAARVTPLTLMERGTGAATDAVGLDTEIETTVGTPIGEVTLDSERRGEGGIERTQEGAATALVTAANPFALAQAGETGVEVAQNVPDEIDRDNTAAVGAAALAVGRETGESIATDARTDPTRFGGSLIGEAALGGAVGRGAGTVARRATDRIRTTGGTRVDLEEVTNPETAAFYRGESTDPDARFPGAEDPDLYQSDPPAAVRQQAVDYTPRAIEQEFEEAGVDAGVDLKKAIETEPEGPNPPAVGDGAGFRTFEGDYESPGAFAGPEFSPNFLKVGERSYSLRPGLPGMGGRPTGVIARTEVKRPDADTLEEFNRELVDERAGETTARTKPAGEVATGEIEAIIPPEAGFRAVDDVTSGGNRFGIGADYYTEVRGRRVPLRLVAPEDDIDASDAVGDLDDVGGRPLRSYGRRADEVDRPAPTPSRPYAGSSSRGTAGGVSDPLSDTLSETSRGTRDRSRRDTRPVSDPISSGLGSTATSRGWSGGSGGGTPTRIGTPTDWSEVGTPTGSSDLGRPTSTSDLGEPTIGSPTTPTPPTQPPTPPTRTPPDPPEIDIGFDNIDPVDSDLEPERFENRIATPADFLF